MEELFPIGELTRDTRKKVLFLVDKTVVKIKELPSCDVAYITFTGPYEKVQGAYKKIFTLIYRNKYTVIGAPMEVYLTDPMKVPAESSKTEIFIPEKKQ